MLIEGYGRPESLEVCVYRRSDAGDLELAYGTVLGAEAARAFARAVGRAEPRKMDCGDEPPFEWVTLQMTGTSYPNAPVGVGGTQDMVIGCDVVEVGPGQTYELDEGVLDALRVEGLPAVLFDLIGPHGLSQRASCRRMKTSRVSIRIAAAVGIASSAPTTPSRAAPTSAAITVTAPGMSTDFDITRG